MKKISIIFLLSCLYISNVLGQDYLLQSYTTGGKDEIYAKRNMATGKNGEIYVASLYKNTFYLQGDSVVGEGVYLAKFTNDLSLIWLKKIVGISDEGSMAGPRLMLALDNYDNIIIGYSNWFGNQLMYDDSITVLINNVELIKLDSAGTRLWRTSVTGSNRLGIKGVAVDNENNILVTGKDLNSDVFITKYNKDGNELWYQTASINGTSKAEKGMVVTTDKHNNIYTAGVLWSDYLNDSIYSIDTVSFGTHKTVFPIPTYTVSYLAKYLPNGTFKWVRYVYSSVQTKYNFYGSSTITAIECFENGNIIVGGYFTNPLLEFSDGFSSVEKNGNDDGFRASFLTSFSPDGDRLWAKTLHNTHNGGTDMIDLSIDTISSIYLLNGYWGTIINERGDTCVDHSSSSYDLLLERYTENGNLKSSSTIGGGGDDEGYDIVTFGNSVFTYSNIGGNLCSVGAESTSFISGYGSNMLILKLTENPTLDVSNLSTEHDLIVYPNPNNGAFTVKIPTENVELCIYNTSGKLIYIKTLQNTELFNADMQNFQNGIYFLNVKSKQFNVTKKILKF